MRFLALALPFVVLAACVGDDPTPTVGNGTSGDAGSALGGGDLPLIDQYDVSLAVSAAAPGGCVGAIDTAINAMGGDYVRGSAFDVTARTAARPGAAVYTNCAEGPGGAFFVIAGAYGVNGALNAQRDSARLLALVQAEEPATPASVSLPTAAAVRTADGVAVPVAGLDNGSCQTRSKSALDAAFASTRNRWSTTGQAFLAVGGGNGSTASVVCVGTEVRGLVIHVVTIDPAVEPASLLASIRTQLITANTIQ